MFRFFPTLSVGFFLAVSFGASLPTRKNRTAADQQLNVKLRLENTYLNRKIKTLESAVQGLTKRIDSGRVHCIAKTTAWDHGALEVVAYLDRQNVDCPRNYFLAQFHLTRKGSHQIRYNYRCCKFIL